MSQEDLNLPNDIEQLKAMIAEREVVHNVAIAERDATITQREAVIASQHDTIDSQLKKLAGLQQQLARLLRKQYGPQKERIDPDQLTLFTTDELEELVKELQQGITDSVSTDDGSCTDKGDGEASCPPEKAKRTGHGRRPLPEHLPREEIFHELSDEERTCPCCGKLRKEIGSETSEQLEFIPAALKVIQHHRKKYASSTELVGEFVLRKSPELMVEHGFVYFICLETVRFSQRHFCLGVHSLHASAGEFAVGHEPVEQQLPVTPQRACHFFHGIKLTSHRSGAPAVQKLACPCRALITPELLEILFHQVCPHRSQVVLH